jgi:predicted RND superfamily exporter protein
MWFAIRDRRLFVAALVPTVLPVVAALGFMGLAGITVRIGTAMILAISLGLAADDTIHLSVRIRDRVLSGSDPESAVSAVLQRTGRPASFSSYVLIIGFATMMVSSLVALQEMGLIASFTMAFALLSDLVLGPAIFVLLSRRWTYPGGRHPDAGTAGADLRLVAAR